MANPPPFPFSVDDFNPLLIGTLPLVLIWNLTWPLNYQDVPEPAIDEGMDFGYDPLSQSPGLRCIKQNGVDVGVDDPQLGSQRYTFGSPDRSQNVEGGLRSPAHLQHLPLCREW